MGRSIRQRTNHGVGTYPANWKEIANRVKEEAGWRCVRCKHPHETSARREACDELCRHEPDGKQRMLTVHHLDCDPANCEDYNLAALCQKCHLEIQGRVDFLQTYMLEHTDWMKPHVEGLQAAMARGGTA